MWTVLSLIGPDRATVQFLAVPGCNGICCFGLLGHGDEAEASATTGFAIDDDLGFPTVPCAQEAEAAVHVLPSPSERQTLKAAQRWYKSVYQRRG